MSVSEWTIEQWVEHGREWLAAGWTWAPGQVAILPNLHTAVVSRVAEGRPMFTETLPVGNGELTYIEYYGQPTAFDSDAVPDMRDAGTRGHALDQVRKAWGSPGMHPARDGQLWLIRDCGGGLIEGPHGTAFFCEAEALLAARRAAP